MSLTITVPASVPSLFHSSFPFVPSSALKNSARSLRQIDGERVAPQD